MPEPRVHVPTKADLEAERRASADLLHQADSVLSRFQAEKIGLLNALANQAVVRGVGEVEQTMKRPPRTSKGS